MSLWTRLHCRGNTQFLPKHFKVRLALRISNTISQLQPFRHSCHGPCCDTDSLSSASHREGPGSIPDQSMWDMWWTKRHWDRSLYEYFFLPLSGTLVLQTHEFIHHRRYIILANIFVKQQTKKVSIFLIHISLFFRASRALRFQRFEFHCPPRTLFVFMLCMW